jgi:16S rRNA (guanine966-N2)-methyltransferase
VTGTRVLDLFAGTGALGLEALSRGAHHVTFVENGAKARRLLEANIALTKSKACTHVLRKDATKLGPAPLPATLVFLDPPYGQGLGHRALKGAAAGGWLAPKALVAWEEADEAPPLDGFETLDVRRYGDTTLTFLEYRA